MRKILTFLIIIIIVGLTILVGESVLTVSRDPYLSYGSIILTDRKGEKITEKGKEGGYMVPYSGSLDIPLIRHIIAAEDARYYEHNGINIEAKIGSIMANWKAGTIVRGGSTITEQYIKNSYYPNAPRTLLQKAREGIGALYLETVYTKEQILEKYLNSLYLGNTLYGIGSALASYYPGLNPDQLSDDDILDIITRIHSPNVKKDNIDTVLSYRDTIAKRIGLSSTTNNLLEHTRTTYTDKFPLLSARIVRAIRLYCSGDRSELEQFMIASRGDICSGKSHEIQLSVDASLMRFIQETIIGVLSPLASENVHNGAVYIYNPTQKKILAYIANSGGPMVKDTAIDMITSRRSVGSVLKPFIYLLALRDGADSESLIMDNAAYTYPTGYEEKLFIPQNYVPKSYGPIRLREALGNSLNSATVRISERIGIGRIYDFFRSIGLDMEHDAGYYGYGISIGTVELTLENIVKTYTYLLDTTDKDIFLVKEMLSDPSNRSKTFGISSILNTSIPLPVKTGTSTDFRDNWTISYHPDAIIGVWVGNTDASPMRDVSGVSGAGPIWHRISEYMIAQRFIYPEEKEIPDGVSQLSLCLDTKCFQKELRFSKYKTPPKSRILNHLYYNEDFYTPLTDEEKYGWNVKK